MRYEEVGPPLSFLAGVAGAFAGWLLATHDGTALSHLPHQLLLGVPLAMLVPILLKGDGRDIRSAAIWGAAGLASGVVLSLVVSA